MKDKVRILQGTISGLYYLHTLNPPFVHCNLTTENILLHEGLKAKIGGFSIANTNFAHNREYMPPEAQEDVQLLHPSYDIFSLGHLMVVVMNQQEIHPLLPFQYINEAGELSLRCEVDRRAGFIDEEYNTYHTKELSSK